MIDKQIATLGRILKNDDIQGYAGDAFWNLIQAVITADMFAGVEAAKDIKELIFHMPTLIFWDKMKRFLLGTYKCFSDQVKMAAKFEEDYAEYNSFVKQQIYLVDALDDDMKIDNFSALTRCFLLTDLSQELYFKLAKLISVSTSFELAYLKEKDVDFSSKNTAMISMLYHNGLFTQIEREDGTTAYVLSGLAKALKFNSLNFDEDAGNQSRMPSMEEIILPIPEPVSTFDIEKILGEGSLMVN